MRGERRSPQLAESLRPHQPDLLVGIESRGFLVAAPLAYALGCGFAMIRKQGKLPGKTVRFTYDLEYGSDTIEMQEDAVARGSAGCGARRSPRDRWHDAGGDRSCPPARRRRRRRRMHHRAQLLTRPGPDRCPVERDGRLRRLTLVRVNRRCRDGSPRGYGRSPRKAGRRRPAGYDRGSEYRPNCRPRQNGGRPGINARYRRCRHQQPIGRVGRQRLENVTTSGAPGFSTRPISRITSRGRVNWCTATHNVAPSNSPPANGSRGSQFKSCTRHSSRKGFSANSQAFPPIPTTRE